MSSVEVMPDKVSWSNKVKVAVDMRGKDVQDLLSTKLSSAKICLFNSFFIHHRS